MSNTFRTQDTHPYATILGKLGVHVRTETYRTERAAKMAARSAIRNGSADSAGIWLGNDMIDSLGAQR